MRGKTRKATLLAMAAVTTGLQGKAYAQAIIPAASLLKPHARQIELKGTCEESEDGLVFQGDRKSRKYMQDSLFPAYARAQIVRQLQENGNTVDTPESIWSKSTRLLICSAATGPAVTVQSHKDVSRSYVFFKPEDDTLADYRQRYGWTQAAISDAELETIKRWHEQGHGFIDRRMLKRLRGVDEQSAEISAPEEAISDAHAFCGGIATGTLRHSAIQSWLELRADSDPQQDAVHSVIGYLDDALIANLEDVCRPDRFQGEKTNPKQVFKKAVAAFLRHATLK